MLSSNVYTVNYCYRFICHNFFATTVFRKKSVGTMPPKMRRQTNDQMEETRTKINFDKPASFNESEDDYVFSSPFHKSAVVIKPQDIKQKLMIASNITQKCKNLMNKQSIEGKSGNYIDILREYTKLPKTELISVNNEITSRDRSFTKCIKDIQIIPESVSVMLADDIRTIFFKYMEEANNFPPKKMDFLRDLKYISASYLHESLPIQRLVRNKLLKYEHFPQSNRYLLSEHPEKVYQRTLYLNHIKNLRLEKKNFVYVEVKRINSKYLTSSGFIAGLAASPATGKFEKFFTKDSSELNAKKWIQQRILEIVPVNSIVILAQPKMRKNLSSVSSKDDLMAWLYLNQIPYEDNDHTAVLYDLYVKHKHTVKQQGLYDHVFLNAGFTVMNLPTEWRSLNYFFSIWSDVNVFGEYHPIKPEVLKQKILNSTQMITDLKEAEQNLIDREIKMMKEDMAMETVMEKLRVMIKDGQSHQINIPKECFGDKSDDFDINISKYVIE